MIRLIEILLGCTYMFAAALKLSGSGSGSGSESGTIVESLGHSALIILICGEFLMALWFFSGRRLVLASLVSTVMLSCFTAMLINEANTPSPRDCGCFGHSMEKSNTAVVRRSLYWDAGRNVGLMTACGIVTIGRYNMGQKRGLL